MNREGLRDTQSAPRSLKQPGAQQRGLAQRKKSHRTEAPGGSKDAQAEQPKRAGRSSFSPGSEDHGSPAARRKLSDASNASEDLSKDSGCVSGKLSDSSSEISDCASEGNKRDSPSSDSDGSWTDSRAQGAPCVKAHRQDAALGPVNCSGAFMDLMMGDTTEDLVREVDDLRSENEYLKDEVEELRCEMLEMRDMFQEDEAFQLQDLRRQLEQANKTCRILHYRLRKAERRSIRVAQTGQVDGELVRSLEHDVKVAKSVSCRLHTELEAVQGRNAQLEWDNEALREKAQELEVVQQVLQTELEKVRESSAKKKISRCANSKSEKRLSQQMEDDSADLKVQLHFAKEELALMCKKLTKMVSESDAIREELAKYYAAFGDVEAAQVLPSSGRSREVEVKAHLKLVEEEATLLSRRIVELEVENRGLRAEMSDLRMKCGARGDEEGEDSREVTSERESARGPSREDALNPGPRTCEQELEKKGDAETTSSGCDVTREGPVGGEWDPSDSREEKDLGAAKETSAKHLQALRHLRDHSCILSAAVKLLTAKNRHSWSPSAGDAKPNGKAPKAFLGQSLELLQAMLEAFIQRVDTLLTEDQSRTPTHVDVQAGARTQTTLQTRDSVVSDVDPKTRLSLQILWIVHQWCGGEGAAQEAEHTQQEVQTKVVLQGLLRDVCKELQEEQEEQQEQEEKEEQEEQKEQQEQEEQEEQEGGSSASEAAEPTLCDGAPLHGSSHCSTNRPSGKPCRPRFPPLGFSRRKNWCPLGPELPQPDGGDRVKTWDHPLMPLSFPDLDLERLVTERSHTAPEKSEVRLYYSPPSARRVEQARLKHSPMSVESPTAWCTPPTSFSQLCLAGLGDDVKETRLDAPQKERPAGRSSGIRPRMVSVAQQTDGPQEPCRVAQPRSGSSKVLDGISPRAERLRSSTSSPKLYRRHSGASSLPSSPGLGSSPAERPLWSPSHSNAPGSTAAWSRQSTYRGGGAPTHSSSSRTSSKTAGSQRCGLVTEFLRRVSGRTEKSGSVQRTKSPRMMERVPRPAAPLQRADSVTRIVNQRFMKQKEEAGPGERGRSLRSNPTAARKEDGNLDCSSSSSLTFCFARPNRSFQKQTSGKAQRTRTAHTEAVAGSKP